MGSAKCPGKLMIAGEYGSIYGEPVLIAGVDLEAKIELTLRKDRKVVLWSKNVDGKSEDSLDSLKRYYSNCTNAWKKYYEKDERDSLIEIQSDPYSVMRVAVARFLNLYEAERGFELKVDSNIPVGSGLGSSAAITALVLKVLQKEFKIDWEIREFNQQVYEVEKIIHGKPSGGDNSGVVYGGYISFKRMDGDFKIRRLDNSHGLFERVILIDSGKPSETTAEMVRMIEDKKLDNLEKHNKVIHEIGRIAGESINGINSGNYDSGLITQNQRALEELGVVGQAGLNIVDEIEQLGGNAKICGAGGLVSGAGIILAYHKNTDKLANFVKKKGYKYYDVKLGVQGCY